MYDIFRLIYTTLRLIYVDVYDIYDSLDVYLLTYLFISLQQRQELALQVAYTSVDRVHRYVKTLMALPFLPFQEIFPTFDRLSVD